MYTRTFHTHASSYRIDTIVIRFNGNFSTLSRNTGNRSYQNQTVVNFGHFELEKTAKKFIGRAGYQNFRIVVLVIDFQHDSPHGLTLPVKIRRYLFGFRQQQLITVVIDQQHLLFPNLVNFGTYQFAYFIFISIVYGIFLQIENLRSQCLAQVQNSSTTEFLEMHLVGHLLADLEIGVGFPSFRQRNLQITVGHRSVFHNLTVTPYFEIPLRRIHDYIEVFIGPEHLCQYVAERFFQHTNHRSYFDVLQLFELCKGIDHANGFLFFCHII